MFKLPLRLLVLSFLAMPVSFSVPVPQEPPEPYERIPNYQGGFPEALYPRWLSFTQADARLGPVPNGFPPNENPLFVLTNSSQMSEGCSSVGVDSRGVAHVVQIIGGADGGVGYYNTRYDTRSTNGFSPRTTLFPTTSSQVALNCDLWVDSQDQVHVAWTVGEIVNSAIDRTNIAYRVLNDNGWQPSLGGAPLYLTQAQSGPMGSEFYTFTQIITDSTGNPHVIGTYSSSIPGSPPNGPRRFTVNPIAMEEFAGVSPQRIAMGPSNQLFVAGIVNGGPGYMTRSAQGGWSGPVQVSATGTGIDIAVDSMGSPHVIFHTMVQNPQPPANLYQINYWNNGVSSGIRDTGISYKRILIDSRDQIHVIYSRGVAAYPWIPTSPEVWHLCYAARVKNPNPSMINPEWRLQEPLAATVAEYARGRPPGPAPFPGEITQGAISEVAISKNDVIHVFDQMGYYTRMIEYGLGVRDPLAMTPALPNGLINLTSGNFHFNLGLFSTRGHGPTQSASVIYNSLEYGGGLIAPGWKLNCEIYLVDHWQAVNNPGGSYTDQPQESVTVFLPDGRPIHFRYRSFSEGSLDLCYLVAEDEFGYFAKLERLQWNTLTPEYELTFKSGDVWTFNNAGKIREMRDSTDNCIVFTYMDGRLTEIRDMTTSPSGQGGRNTSIEYELGSIRHCRRIESITDPAGASYDFEYLGQHLKSVEFHAGIGTPTWEFEYYMDNNAPEKRRVNLLQDLSTPRGKVENYHYRCRYQLDNRIVEVEDPAAYILPGATGDGGGPQVATPKLKVKYETPAMFQNSYDTFVTCKRKNNGGGDVELRYVHDPRRGLVMEFHDPYSQQMGHLTRMFNEYGLVTDETDRYGCMTEYTYWPPDPALTPHVRDNLQEVERSRGTGAGMDTVAYYVYSIEQEFTRLQTFVQTARSANESMATTRATSYLYDNEGRLTTIGHPTVIRPDGAEQGATTQFNYGGPRGALSSVTDENGNTTSFSSFNGVLGLPQSILRGGGSQAESLTYDPMGNQLTHTAASGGLMNESPGSSIVVLDGMYRVSTSADPSGRTTTYDYDLDSNRVFVQPPAGGSSTTTFDKRGFATGGTTPDGSWSQLVDEDGNVQRSTDMRGFSTNYDFDDLGRLIEVRSPGGTTGGGGGGPATHTTQYEHDIWNGATHLMNTIQVGSTNRVTTTTYDRRCRPISVLQPDGATRIDTIYNEIDEAVATETYYGATLQQCQVNFLDHRGRSAGTRAQPISFSFGQAESMNSRTWWSLLSGTGAVLQSVGPRGEVSSPASVVDKVTYVRDQRGRVIQVQQPVDGQMTTVQENVYGDDDLVTESRIPNPANPSAGMVTHRKFSYTTRKELKTSVNANNQGLTYAYSVLPGQIDNVTDAGGVVTKTTYYSDTQRVDEVIEGFGTGIETRTKSVWTNGLLSQTQVFNPAGGGFNATFARTYDAAGRLETLAAPQVLTEVMSYNAFGELSTHVSGSATANHSYNPLGQRTDTGWSGAYSDGVDRGFDALGNLTFVDDGAFRKEWTYDAVTGLPTSERFYLMGTLWKSHDYEYDESGNLIEMTDGENTVHAWVYDDANRVIGIRYGGIEVCSLAYTQAGLLAMSTLRNSMGSAIARTVYQYDSKGRRERALTTRTGGGAVLADLRWEYDTRDRVTKVNYYHLGVETSIGYNFTGEVVTENTTGNGGGAVPPPFENQFGDAPTGNASSASDEAEATPSAPISVANRSASYTYDRGGNRTSQTVGGVTTNYTYNSGSQLVSESGGGRSVDHEYDTWGNEVERTTTESGTTTLETYGYNYLNRMSNYVRAVNGNVVAQWSYQFWASGERAGKTNLANNTGGMYATQGDNVVTDYTVSLGVVSHANTYAQGLGLDQKSLRIPVSGGRIHYVGDLVGTVAVTLTDSGTKSEECVRDIWGLTLAGDTDNERYGFAQREHNMESGLVYMRHRMYDPRIGRFTQTDPLTLNRPADHFTYARNNPVTSTDPSGELTKDYADHLRTKAYNSRVYLRDPYLADLYDRLLHAEEEKDRQRNAGDTAGEARSLKDIQWLNRRIKEHEYSQTSEPSKIVLDRTPPVGATRATHDKWRETTDGMYDGIFDATVDIAIGFAVGGIGKVVRGVSRTLGKLKFLGSNKWESSGGLIYGFDPKVGNRVKHVLAHTAEDISKKSHSVFSVPKKDVLALVDEAWILKGKPVSPGNYVVEMGRVIGTRGETSIKLVVVPGTNEIITAFPIGR